MGFGPAITRFVFRTLVSLAVPIYIYAREISRYQLFVKRVELRNVNRALWYPYIQTK